MRSARPQPTATAALVVVLLALAALAVPAGARAAARPLVLRPTPLASEGLLDDGDHLVGLVTRARYDERSTVAVVDVTGRTPTRTLTAPRPGCAAVELRGPELLWSCTPTAAAADRYDEADEGIVALVATGATTTLPDLSGTLQPNDDRVAYTALGARWAEATRSGYHYAVGLAVDRATGFVAAPAAGSSPADVDVDRDAPALVRPLCAAVRQPFDNDAFLGREPGRLLHVDGWWAGEGFDDAYGDGPRRVVLERCGRTRAVLHDELPEASVRGPVLGVGFVAWVEQGSPSSPGATLVVRRLAGRRIGAARRLALTVPGVPVALGPRLYLHDGSGALQRVRLG